MLSRTFLTFSFLLAGGLAGCVAGAPAATTTEAPPEAPTSELGPRHQTPVVIDTDMAQDDWMAISFVLQRKDLDVRAITVASTGEATCDLIAGETPGADIALGLLALAGKDDGHTVVACGRTQPLRGDHVFPRVWTDNVNRVGG